MNLEIAREKLKGLLEGKEEKPVETVGEFAEAYLESLKSTRRVRWRGRRGRSRIAHRPPNILRGEGRGLLARAAGAIPDLGE